MTTNPVTDAEATRITRLEAVAAVRAYTADDDRSGDLIVNESTNPRELAQAAVSLASALLRVLPAPTGAHVLDEYVNVAVIGELGVGTVPGDEVAAVLRRCAGTAEAFLEADQGWVGSDRAVVLITHEDLFRCHRRQVVAVAAASRPPRSPQPRRRRSR